MPPRSPTKITPARRASTSQSKSPTRTRRARQTNTETAISIGAAIGSMALLASLLLSIPLLPVDTFKSLQHVYSPRVIPENSQVIRPLDSAVLDTVAPPSRSSHTKVRHFFWVPPDLCCSRDTVTAAETA